MELFNKHYQNKFDLLKDLKEWVNKLSNQCEIENITINKYNKNQTYVATYGSFKFDADECLEVYELIYPDIC